MLQLYYPLWRCGRLGLRDPDAAVGLRPENLKLDLRLAFFACLITFIPFAVGHHFLWSAYFHRPFVPRLPPALPTLVLTHFLGVALPEEVFYRGFVQPGLKQAMRRRWRILGADVGWEIPLTSFLFALGHFAGEYDPSRLAPFFPGLIFGWLRARSGSVWGAVVYHALCNIVSAMLYACYTG